MDFGKWPFICVFMLCRAAFAAELQVNDGAFFSPHHCNLRVDHGGDVLFLQLEYNEKCNDGPGFFDLTRTSDSEFAGTQELTLDERFMEVCTPASYIAKPCGDDLYTRRGKFIGRVGDRIVTVTHLTILNATAFNFKTTTKLMRADKVLGLWDGTVIEGNFSQGFAER